MENQETSGWGKREEKGDPLSYLIEVSPDAGDTTNQSPSPSFSKRLSNLFSNIADSEF